MSGRCEREPGTLHAEIYAVVLAVSRGLALWRGSGSALDPAGKKESPDVREPSGEIFFARREGVIAAGWKI
jgi:hypothetical protein